MAHQIPNHWFSPTLDHYNEPRISIIPEVIFFWTQSGERGKVSSLLFSDWWTSLILISDSSKHHKTLFNFIFYEYFLTELNKQVDLCWIQGPGSRIWQKPVWTGQYRNPCLKAKRNNLWFLWIFNFLLRDREERNLNDLLNLKNLHSVLKA